MYEISLCYQYSFAFYSLTLHKLYAYFCSRYDQIIIISYFIQKKQISLEIMLTIINKILILCKEYDVKNSYVYFKIIWRNFLHVFCN